MWPMRVYFKRKSFVISLHFSRCWVICKGQTHKLRLLSSPARSSVIKALHRQRRGVDSIPAGGGGPLTDEFFSTVLG